MSNVKRGRGQRADRSRWVFGGIIAVLALTDLFIWATLWNVPNPVSALLVGPPPAQTLPLPRPVFAAAASGGTGTAVK